MGSRNGFFNNCREATIYLSIEKNIILFNTNVNKLKI